MCFSIMTSPGHNVLIPSPGFPAYETLLGNIQNCEIRTYECLPDKGWECDVEQMESLIDDKTSFVLIVSLRSGRTASESDAVKFGAELAMPSPLSI
jgi:tyrosine aminotransferase